MNPTLEDYFEDYQSSPAYTPLHFTRWLLFARKRDGREVIHRCCGKLAKTGIFREILREVVPRRLDLISLHGSADLLGKSAVNDLSALQGIAVWAENKKILTKASRFAQLDTIHDCIVHFSGKNWQSDFTNFVLSLSDQDKESCFACDVDHIGSFQPWTSIPLTQMVERMSFSWFPDLIESDGITSHLQPIMSLSEKCVYGFEGLARAELDGRTLNGGMLLDAAKAFGELEAFDSKAVIAAIRVGSQEIKKSEKLFVNIVPCFIHDPKVDLAHVWQAAEQYKINRSQIVFEFIESESMPDTSLLSKLVKHVRTKGAQIALDDFGAGHASLGLLDELRPDIVKFDKRLMPTKKDDRKLELISNLVDYAKKLEVMTLAEGIETTQQFKFAQETGFDFVQGWLLGRPEAVAVRPDWPLD